MISVSLTNLTKTETETQKFEVTGSYIYIFLNKIMFSQKNTKNLTFYIVRSYLVIAIKISTKMFIDWVIQNVKDLAL